MYIEYFQTYKHIVFSLWLLAHKYYYFRTFRYMLNTYVPAKMEFAEIQNNKIITFNSQQNSCSDLYAGNFHVLYMC